MWRNMNGKLLLLESLICMLICSEGALLCCYSGESGRASRHLSSLLSLVLGRWLCGLALGSSLISPSLVVLGWFVRFVSWLESGREKKVRTFVAKKKSHFLFVQRKTLSFWLVVWHVGSWQLERQKNLVCLRAVSLRVMSIKWMFWWRIVQLYLGEWRPLFTHLCQSCSGETGWCFTSSCVHLGASKFGETVYKFEQCSINFKL